jgi:hypothetical protein
MRKVLISVEGQTEETFVQAILDPHFSPTQLYLQPVLLKTRHLPGRPAERGGYVSYAKVKREIQALLGDTSAVVTTMYDLYALPGDFPGLDTQPEGTGAQKVAHLERAFAQDIGGHNRFRPYLQLYEFEALLFSAPEAINNWLDGTDQDLRRLQRVCQEFPNPEEIDDDPHTSPSHRIRRIFPEYEKVLAGSRIAMEIGIDAIRNACPHFSAWMDWLESL